MTTRVVEFLFQKEASHEDQSQVIPLCQEGNGIEVRNAPFDVGGSGALVWISGNIVTSYQKTGIVTNGSVAATIIGNVLTGLGPVDFIAQNGIQVGFGGTAIVREGEAEGSSLLLTNFPLP